MNTSSSDIIEDKPSSETPTRPLIIESASNTILEAATQAFKNLDIKRSNPSEIKKLVSDIWTLLPPIASDNSLDELAQSLLKGDSSANIEFRSRLQELSLWNDKYSPCPHVNSLPADYHKQLLEIEFLNSVVKAYPHTKPANPTINSLRVARLIGAAILTAQGNAESINKNINVIVTQLNALLPITSLNERAIRFLESNQFGESFISSLNFYSGQLTSRSGFDGGFAGDFGGGPDDRPQMPGFGRPFNPSGPGGGFIWPPNPGAGGAPGLPLPFPPPMPEDPTIPGGLECLPEFIRAFIDIIGPALGRLNYSIDSVSPINACVGETITITGSGFFFDGNLVRIRFKGAEPGSTVLSEEVTPISDTQIDVVVPAGAHCGTIELGLDEPLTVLACDVSLTLDLTTRSSFEFLGGETTTTLGFRHPRRRGCLRPDEVIDINHVSCNAQSLLLRITSDDPAVDEFSRSYSGSIPRFTRYTIPSPSAEAEILVEVTATGRCGTDSHSLSLMVDQIRPIAPSGPALFTPGRFRNWNHNIDRTIMQFAPTTREDLINAVYAAEASNRRLAIAGSGFSFTECAVSQNETDYVLLDTIYLNEILTLPIDDILNDRAQTILSTDNINQYSEVLDSGELTSLSQRLVYVEAGIKLANLNFELSRLGLALPTMGGGDRQSLTGAFSTGTHGSTLHLPPIADFVRAIHLIGTDGQEWWIESSSRRITDPEKMEAQRGELFSLCTNIVYDDNLFNATLVSFGSAGVIYAVVYETVDAHRMSLETIYTNWPLAQNWLREKVLETPRDEDHWFIEVLVLADGKSYITTNNLTALPVNLPAEEEGLSDRTLAVILVNALPAALGLTGGLIGLLLAYIPAEFARMTGYYLSFQIARGNQARENLAAVFGLMSSVRYVLSMLDSDPETDAINQAVPGLINDIWKLGDIIPAGREIVDAIVTQVTEGKRPERSRASNPIVLPSDDALMHKDRTARTSAEPLPSRGSRWGDEVQWGKSPSFDRLVESHEYVVRPDQLISFIDGLLAIANEIRNRRTSTALLLALPIRFTKRSIATMAMQRHDLNCHVELFVMERLDGTEEFLTRAREFANSVGAIPHWGQLHDEARNFDDVYGASRVRQFSNQMQILANGEPRTFRNQFSVIRNLLSR